MKANKKKGIALFALTLMITSLLLINMNGPTTAQEPNGLIHLDGPPLTPIHLNSNKTLTPVHMHYKEGLIEQTPPEGTKWHELSPNFCPDWNITDWIDKDINNELSPNDQINMTNEDGNSTWYHIDRVTYTLNISQLPPEPFARKFIEFKGPPDYTDPLNAPVCTYWHEVHPGYSNVYHIVGSTGPLQFCTNITLQKIVNGLPVDPPTMWHVDDVATDLILREKIMDPRCTWWHAIYPEEEFCKWYHITSWEDIEPLEEPGHGMLSPGDQIDMIEEESGIKTWYFVDRVTVTLNVSNYYEPSMRMKIELKTWWFEEMFEAFKYPLYSLWHEVYPVYSNVFQLTGWDWLFDDNCNGVLDVCDYIWLQNITHGHIGTEDRWHIDDITYDLILNRKMGDPYCTWWHELYPDCCLYDYHVIGWDDNGDELLSPCDNVTMTVTPGDTTDDYHVENVTLTLNLTVNDPEQGPFSQGERIFIELIDHYETTHYYYAKIEPWSTNWMVVCPEDWFGLKVWINSWNDTCNCVLSRCDNITLIDPTGAPFGNCHVDEVAVDMIVKKIGEEPPPPSWYKKPPYDDYAPSGMPDFDQKQDAWHPPQQPGVWTWCGPTAVANSLWWFDSKYDPSNIVPAFPGVPDDHHVKNVDPLVKNLTYWMDTDGNRTGDGHTGTRWQDMQWGIEQYLQQQGVTTLEVHNRTFPEFPWIEDEIYACQDVVLLLEFWWWNPTGGWERVYQPYDLPGGESGHYVTCAGVNSSTYELLICDPWWDAAEAGWPGDIPVPHAPHGDPTVHNDTQYVSHDAYLVTQWMGPPPGPYGGQPIEELVNYLQQYNPAYGPDYHTFIKAAVVTSPLEACGVEITNVTVSHCGNLVNEAYKTWTLKVNVTVHNNGTAPINCTVNAYYSNVTGTYQIGTSQNVTDLPSCNYVTLTFNWDFAGQPAGALYTLKANATCLCGASDEYTYGQVKVRLWGDVDGSGTVNVLDVKKTVLTWSAILTEPFADIDGNCVVNVLDVKKCVLLWSGIIS